MAAFSNGFQGDEKSLKLIIDNIDKKSILLDGISCLGVVEITDAGDKAYFFKRTDGVVTPGQAGRQVQWNNTGVIRDEVLLDKSFQAADFIPMYKTTNTVDIVNDRQAYDAQLIANQHNVAALAYLADEGKEFATGIISTAEGALDALMDGIEEFKKLNKDAGMVPTAIYVSNDFAKLLYKNDAWSHYANNIPSYAENYNNIIGRIGSALVFEADDASDNEVKFEFIVMNYNGFVAPLNLTSWAIRDGAALGYPSARIIAGETRYGFKLTDQNLVLVGGDGKLSTPQLYYNNSTTAIMWSPVPNATGYTYNTTDSESATSTASTTGTSIAVSTTAGYGIKYEVKATGDATHPDSDYSAPYVVYKYNTPTSVTADWANSTLTAHVSDTAFAAMIGAEEIGYNFDITVPGTEFSSGASVTPDENGDITLDLTGFKTSFPDGATAVVCLTGTGGSYNDNNYSTITSDTIEVGILPPPPLTQLDPVSDLIFENSGYIAWTNPATVGRIELEVQIPVTEDSAATYYIDAGQNNKGWIWSDTNVAAWYENANINDEITIKVTNLTTDDTTYLNSDDRYIKLKKGQPQPQYTNLAFDQSTYTCSWTHPTVNIGVNIGDNQSNPGWHGAFVVYDSNNQEIGRSEAGAYYFSDTAWVVDGPNGNPSITWESGATQWNPGDTYSFEIGLNSYYQFETIEGDVRGFTRHDYTTTSINGTIS